MNPVSLTQVFSPWLNDYPVVGIYGKFITDRLVDIMFEGSSNKNLTNL